MRNDRKNIIVEKCIAFSLLVISYTEVLEHNRKFVIAKQLLRSATSIGANVSEAQNAESISDFIHKMKIAAKEASETRYWLTLCRHSDGYLYDQEIDNQLQDIIRILSRIIVTSKRIMQ